MKPELLYHFTCDHGRRDIGTSNCLLIPHAHPLLGCKVLWLTSHAEPDRDAVGLTMDSISCDRLKYRYLVSDVDSARRWLDSPERASAPGTVILDLERYGDPEQWWITTQAVRAKLDRSYQN